MWERHERHKRGTKGTVGTCFTRVFVDTKISRFSNKDFLKAEKREGNGSECMVDMWEGRGNVMVPLRSCRVQKVAVQVHLLGCKAYKKKVQRRLMEGKMVQRRLMEGVGTLLFPLEGAG